MREARRISRTPSQWRDLGELERRRHLEALLGILRRAREGGEAWYAEALETAAAAKARASERVPWQRDVGLERGPVWVDEGGTLHVTARLVLDAD